jgi:hypothetical protein
MADTGLKDSSFKTSIIGGVELVLIGVAGYLLSKLNKGDISKTLLPVSGILIVVVILHTILWYLYSTYNPLSMNLYYLVATSFSIIVSLTALSISLINQG